MGHVKGMFCMSINCIALGKRISFYRLKFNMTQEKLADLTDCSREYIAYLESGAKTPSLPILINLANVLHGCRSRGLSRRWKHGKMHSKNTAYHHFANDKPIFLRTFCKRFCL